MKPCPVCGEVPAVEVFTRRGFPDRCDNGDWHAVRHYCGMTTPSFEHVSISCEAKTEKKAIELWDGYVEKIEAKRTPPYEQMTMF